MYTHTHTNERGQGRIRAVVARRASFAHLPLVWRPPPAPPPFPTDQTQPNSPTLPAADEPLDVEHMSLVVRASRRTCSFTPGRAC
jgi:hypothetical protein